MNKTVSVVAALAVIQFAVACTSGTAKSNSEQPTQPPKTTQVSAPKPRSNIQPPTAEEAYRLQDDCTRRGEAILRDNAIGSALTQEQVSRYNATTNRCYVRLEVHAADLSEWEKYDYSVFLFDGQTKELLGSTKSVGGAQGKTSWVGFAPPCGDKQCVEEKIGDCMKGKDCDPN